MNDPRVEILPPVIVTSKSGDELAALLRASLRAGVPIDEVRGLHPHAMWVDEVREWRHAARPTATDQFGAWWVALLMVAVSIFGIGYACGSDRIVGSDRAMAVLLGLSVLAVTLPYCVRSFRIGDLAQRRKRVDHAGW